ncbi:hypothetical protein LINPERPRIM_LOCUS26139, partial [Linum perenne]
MKLVKDKRRRQVSLFKRRTSLFKKTRMVTERMNQEFDLLKQQINTEKQISVVLKEISKNARCGSWFMKSISKMGLAELLNMKKWLVKFE